MSVDPAPTVRPERPGDEGALRDLHRAAFGDHGEAVADLVDAQRAGATPADGPSLVAVDPDSSVVGHIGVTRSWLDAPRRLVEVPVLSPLAVRPDRQRRGTGALLVRAAVQALAERGAPVVFLEGDPAYYRRFGFEPGAQHGFRRPSLRIPPAAFQVLRLPAYEPWMTGTFVYPDVFWRLDAVGLRDPDAS